MKSNESYKFKSISVNNLFLILLAILCLAYALYIAVKYANQIPLDFDSFRQTQTALTSYWLIRNGFSFAYETPVGGIPWSIPFEFPIYQFIVSKVSQITDLSLNVTGRIVSFVFLLLCLVPARSITRNLNLSNSVFYIFTALLFSSPLYLYWGRAFLIETAATFFSVAAIKYFIDIVQERNSFKHIFLFLLFMTLGMLQKITTASPVLAVLSVVYLVIIIKEENTIRSAFLSKKMIWALIYFGVPLAVGAVWVLYTDQVKSLNSFASTSLTSSARTKWNWGTLNLRLHPFFYTDVLWRRGLGGNLLGLLALIISMCIKTNRPIKLIIITSLSMWLLPLLLYTSLHVVHDYYQVANVIFLIYAISVSLGQVLLDYTFNIKSIPLMMAFIMVASNYSSFNNSYHNILKIKFNKNNSRDYAISEILKREIPEERYFVAFGNNWSSTFSYLSERKSFTVPQYYRQYEKIARNPEHFIEESRLGAVVVCYTPSPPISVLHQKLPVARSPSIDALIRWSSSDRSWKVGELKGCYISVPEDGLMKSASEFSQTDCQGNISLVDMTQVGSSKILTISGWLAINGQQGIANEKVYITLMKSKQPFYFEALLVPPPENNHYSNQFDFMSVGFSRVLDTDSLDGKYTVGIARLNRGHLKLCQFQEELLID